jgi:hypothetical protein
MDADGTALFHGTKMNGRYMTPLPCPLQGTNPAGTHAPDRAQGPCRYRVFPGYCRWGAGDGIAADKRIMVSPMKKMYMRCLGILVFLVMIGSILGAGCMQSSAMSTVTPQPATEPATPVPTEVTTPVPVPVTTATPEEVVTIVRHVSLVKDVKDSKLLYSLQVPVEWSPSTWRMENPENYEGFMYQTDLVANDTFYINMYENYRNRDQNYRDECKGWVPSPNMSVVTINGIVFDRFESTANGLTNVTYVSRQTSMNDFGYLGVLAFTADTSKNRFAVEDYDKVVSSFRYYSREKVSSMPGQEIPYILPDEGDGGSVRSASKSGSSSSAKKSSGGCALSRK